MKPFGKLFAGYLVGSLKRLPDPLAAELARQAR